MSEVNITPNGEEVKGLDGLRPAEASAMRALHEAVEALKRIRLRISEFDKQDQAALAIGLAVLAGNEVEGSLSAVLAACRVNGRLGAYVNDLCTYLPAEIQGQPCGHYAASVFDGFEREIKSIAGVSLG